MNEIRPGILGDSFVSEYFDILIIVIGKPMTMEWRLISIRVHLLKTQKKRKKETTTTATTTTKHWRYESSISSISMLFTIRFNIIEFKSAPYMISWGS